MTTPNDEPAAGGRAAPAPGRPAEATPVAHLGRTGQPGPSALSVGPAPGMRELPVLPSSGDRARRLHGAGMRSRQLWAHVVVVAWAVAALCAAGAQESLPVARWLAIHLFLLGGATTALVVWSEHFAIALLRATPPDPRWSTVRLTAANAGVLGVVAGVWAQLPGLVTAAAALLAAAVVAHLVMLVRLGRGALGGRLAPVVGYYRAATVALVLGVVLGWLLATGRAGPGSHAAYRLAHVHVTLFGWIGLPVLGTLFMLWPTVLGVRMADRTAALARRVLVPTGAGLLLAVAGTAHGLLWAGAVGMALYAAGVAVALWLFVGTLRGGRPVSAAAAWMLGAASVWLFLGVIADLVLLATGSSADAQEGTGVLVPVLLLGLVAQVLIGALTYLLPVVLGSGPRQRPALRAVLERGWRIRLMALNTGVALLALPGPFGTGGMLLAAASGLAFVALTVVVLVRGSAAARTREADGTPAGTPGAEAGGATDPARPSPRPVVWGTAAGAVVTVLAVLVANSGGTTGGPAVAADAAAGGAAPVTRTVEVTLDDMRVRPARVEVAEGTALTLKVTNEDAQRHDLAVEDGPATALLSKGESDTLDLGRITGDREAWCTLPGHRAAGMTMDIVVRKTSGSGTDAGAGHGSHDGHAARAAGGGPDLMADFSENWRRRSADLAPAPGGTLHRTTLRAAHTDVEVAPGVTQQMWTFGGTAPGPTLRGKVGDVFEITLINDDKGMGHGIDFHAGSLAPDGPMRTIQPGERLVYRFRAEKAGAWLYHCSTAPMLQHMGNGMYGAVVIDPPGLPKVDHEYVLVSSELYLGTPGSEAQVAKMRAGTPDAWAFNGIAAQYGKQPLTVRAGQRARFWVVAAGPTDGVAFHIVGTVFDTVYKEGALLLERGDPGGAQVLDLAPAQGGYVETVFPEAGHYSFVDHDMRHAESGAHGVVKVTR
ncbi:multicopper oxidase domain-containing protein [Streptomyces sp. NPDC005931]|uniref:multicopper oxidase domain-containing protein n=1 Tax=Streptomyces sp. NPDC005931 TaxID=3364737 RepID=UPI0036A8B1BB